MKCSFRGYGFCGWTLEMRPVLVPSLGLHRGPAEGEARALVIAISPRVGRMTIAETRHLVIIE